MTIGATIQKDIRGLILANLPGVAVYDRQAIVEDSTPYITFGPMQTVRNHAKGSRLVIHYVTLHLFYRNSSGSIEARNLADDIIDTLDMAKLPDSSLDCYFTDSVPVYDDDQLTTHIVMNFEVR